jgi:hypothetical protein
MPFRAPHSRGCGGVVVCPQPDETHKAMISRIRNLSAFSEVVEGIRSDRPLSATG